MQINSVRLIKFMREGSNVTMTVKCEFDNNQTCDLIIRRTNEGGSEAFISPYSIPSDVKIIKAPNSQFDMYYKDNHILTGCYSNINHPFLCDTINRKMYNLRLSDFIEDMDTIQAYLEEMEEKLLDSYTFSIRDNNSTQFLVKFTLSDSSLISFINGSNPYGRFTISRYGLSGSSGCFYDASLLVHVYDRGKQFLSIYHKNKDNNNEFMFVPYGKNVGGYISLGVFTLSVNKEQ